MSAIIEQWNHKVTTRIELGGTSDVNSLSYPESTAHDWIPNGTGEVQDLPSNHPILSYHLPHLESSVICAELIVIKLEDVIETSEVLLCKSL